MGQAIALSSLADRFLKGKSAIAITQQIEERNRRDGSLFAIVAAMSLPRLGDKAHTTPRRSWTLRHLAANVVRLMRSRSAARFLLPPVRPRA